VTNTTIHEIGHMWAGDQTTLASTHDFVWKEAMVEYLKMVHLETIDMDRATSTALGWKLSASRYDDYYPVPGEQPPLLDFYSHVYGAGPLVLFRQIEALFDREKVISALQSVLGTPRTLSVDDVKAALEASTGANLDNYFAAWVVGTGAPKRPVFQVTVTDQGSGTYDVKVDQTNPEDGLFGCAFAITLTGDGANEEHEVWIDLGVDGKTSHTVTGVTPGFVVTGHVFDPHGHTLATEAGSAARVAPAAVYTPWLAPRAPVAYR
jgi:aminopeptidase N